MAASVWQGRCVHLKRWQDKKHLFPCLSPGKTVIPAQAGIQIATLDSRLRGNDGRSVQNPPTFLMHTRKNAFLQ